MYGVSWVLLAGLSACGRRAEADPYDLDFEIPRSEAFAPMLSDYGLYQEPAAELAPADGVLPYELSSELYTDQAYKQRLLRVPEGSLIQEGGDGRLVFPEGSVMVKTFYYPEDMAAPESARRILETRLLVKTAGDWNVATYLWNAEQTDAELLLDGTTLQVAWRDAGGSDWSTDYGVPHQGECVTCHQVDGAAAYIGPTVRNLNRVVSRDGEAVEQLQYLEAQGVLEPGAWSQAPSIPNYKDVDVALEDRARAYLDINCAHCHSPGGWEESSERRFDLRYSTPLAETAIEEEADSLTRQLEEGEMPFLGTTLRHDAGVELVVGYLEGL